MKATKYFTADAAMSFDEIASALGLNKSTVRSVYDSAMKKIREQAKHNSLFEFLPEQPNESTNRNNRHYDRYDS